MNIWRQEYDEGIEISMPHRPIIGEDGKFILDDEGYMTFIKCRVRSISAGYVLNSGKLPSALIGVTGEILTSLGLTPEEDRVEDVSLPEMIKRYGDFLKWFIGEILVYPKIVEKPKKEDEISFEMLSNDDLIFFVTLIDQPLANLRRFLQKPDTGLEALSASQGDEVPADTEPAYGLAEMDTAGV